MELASERGRERGLRTGRGLLIVVRFAHQPTDADPIRCLRVGWRHVQSGTRDGQALGLQRRAEQTVVADAFEARGQHMLEEAGDEGGTVDEDGALAAVVVGAHTHPHALGVSLTASGASSRSAVALGESVARPGITQIPDYVANPVTPPFFDKVVASPHSVVTAHPIDEAGQPTIAARDEILAFFATRLDIASRTAMEAQKS